MVLLSLLPRFSARAPEAALRRATLLLPLLGALACVPDLDSDESTVTTPRVLAVIAEPAEAQPEDEITYTALVADENGVRTDATLAWFYCNAQKPLSELGPVSQDCLSRESGKLSSIGRGSPVSGSLPSEACALFGPNLPQPEEGQLPGRPVDPDQTGGFSQPLMLGLNTGSGDSLVLFEQRLTCDLAGVTPQLGLEYKLRYHRNQNPAANEVRVTRDSGEVQFVQAGDALEVEAGERLELSVRYAECPTVDSCGDAVCGPDETRISCAADCANDVLTGCTGQERYLWFDNRSRTLEVRRESMRLAWYATAGTYQDERTGVDEDAATTSSSNVWTAPSQGNTALWVVLRDARGGVGVIQLAVQVQ